MVIADDEAREPRVQRLEAPITRLSASSRTMSGSASTPETAHASNHPVELVGLLLQPSHLFGLDGEVATEFRDLPFHALRPIGRWLSLAFPQIEGMRIHAGRQLCSHEHRARIAQRAR